jgi:hypothetical protein
MFDIASFVGGMIAGVVMMTFITSALITVYRLWFGKENKNKNKSQNNYRDDDDIYYADSDIERWL